MDGKTKTFLMVIRKVLRELLGALEDYMQECGENVNRSIQRRIR